MWQGCLCCLQRATKRASSEEQGALSATATARFTPAEHHIQDVSVMARRNIQEVLQSFLPMEVRLLACLWLGHLRRELIKLFTLVVSLQGSRAWHFDVYI